jgi:hypothetical protein
LPFFHYHDNEKANPECILQYCSGYPYGAKTISEVISKDMAIRGHKNHVINNPSWDD